MPAAQEWIGLLHPGAANSSVLAQLGHSWLEATDPAQLRAAGSGPVSTWIWPALKCQVCIPALSKLLGGQEGNPHSEAFHSPDLACCRLSPGCLKSRLGLLCCNSLARAPTARRTLLRPHLCIPSPRVFPTSGGGRLFPLALDAGVSPESVCLRSHSSEN